MKQANTHCSCPAHRVAQKCKVDRRLVLANGLRRPLGFLMAWLDHDCATKAEHDQAKADLAKPESHAKRQAGRALLEAIAAQDTADAEKARELLELELGGPSLRW